MKRFFFLLSLSLIFTNLFSQAYEINVKIKGMANEDIILGHHFGNSLYPDDTITVNDQGQGVFKGTESLPGGMYFLYLPGKKYYDFLIGDDQYFSLESDTADFVKNSKFSGSVENTLFFDYQQFMTEKQKLVNDLLTKKKKLEDKSEIEKVDEELKQINEEVTAHIDKIINENSNNFFGKFINATSQIKVPDPPVDEEGNITDSLFQYNYYKDHYFDNFDISDPRLLRTPLYRNKVMHYIQKVVFQMPDSIIQAIDMLIEKSRTTEELFRFMLVTLHNHFANSKIMGMDAVLVHISDVYYLPEATWADQEYMDKLQEYVDKNKPLLIGKIAPDIQMVEIADEHFYHAEEDTSLKNNVYVGDFFNLHNIQANYILIYFWESDCGHCKKSIPELHKLYERNRDIGVEVIAIHMLGGVEGKIKWVDFINDYELYGWKNVWNPYDYSYKEKFNIMSSNILYLLDKDKKILAKQISPEQAEKIILSFEKRKSMN